MKIIYKYSLVANTTLELPSNAELLCVQEQNGFITLWFLVEPENVMEERNFEIYGTGWLIKNADALKYCGTTQINTLVWHVFERIM